MNIQKPEGLLSVVLPNDLPVSPSSQQLLNQDQQDEETSDCPLLTPSPPPGQMHDPSETPPLFNPLEDTPLEMTPSMENINPEDGLNAYIKIVALNSSSKPMNDEPSSRDPMVESSSSSSSGESNEPVCTQLLTQLNTAYHHLAPDAQALFYNQENGGKPPLVGIQLVVPKTPEDYCFMAWNWPLIRKTCFWSLMSILVGCAALVISQIALMPKSGCDPLLKWWQGKLFYEISPASFQNSSESTESGISYLKSIETRLDYLQDLGVRGIRLNSIFPAANDPDLHGNITNLTVIDSTLGTLEDFESLVKKARDKKMYIILDLPLYPFITTFSGRNVQPSQANGTDAPSEMTTSKLELLSTQATTNNLFIDSLPEKIQMKRSVTSTVSERNDEHVTNAIKFWLDVGVRGFYLKGLERFVQDENFVEMLRYWRSIVILKGMLMCNVKALDEAPTEVSDEILKRIDLIDVTLDFTNGTAGIKSQVDKIMEKESYEKFGYPWFHWSTGGVNSQMAPEVQNASIAALLIEMMLPGTPSIFNGDEIGFNCKGEENNTQAYNFGVGSGLPNAHFTQKKCSNKTSELGLERAISAMSKLRSQATPIHDNEIRKNNNFKANYNIRYTSNDLFVIERSYKRRNSYVLVANLGMKTQKQDLSNFYYGGQVVVGPQDKLNKEVHFKGLEILPGEAFVIKLEK